MMDKLEIKTGMKVRCNSWNKGSYIEISDYMITRDSFTVCGKDEKGVFFESEQIMFSTAEEYKEPLKRIERLEIGYKAISYEAQLMFFTDKLNELIDVINEMREASHEQ